MYCTVYMGEFEHYVHTFYQYSSKVILTLIVTGIPVLNLLGFFCGNLNYLINKLKMLISNVQNVQFVYQN